MQADFVFQDNGMETVLAEIRRPGIINQPDIRSTNAGYLTCACLEILI